MQLPSRNTGQVLRKARGKVCKASFIGFMNTPLLFACPVLQVGDLLHMTRLGRISGHKADGTQRLAEKQAPKARQIKGLILNLHAGAKRSAAGERGRSPCPEGIDRLDRSRLAAPCRRPRYNLGMEQMKLDGITQREKHLTEIRNCYWHLRYLRPYQGAKRRKLYRIIQKHKAVLISDGLDPELLRLWCRQFTACHPAAAQQRFDAYLQKNHIDAKKTRIA